MEKNTKKKTKTKKKDESVVLEEKKEDKKNKVVKEEKEDKSKKDKKTKEKTKKEKKGNIIVRFFKAIGRFFKAIFLFFKSAKEEMSKVVWPTKRNMIKYSIATIVFIVFFAIYFYGIEVLMAWLKSIIVIV